MLSDLLVFYAFLSIPVALAIGYGIHLYIELQKKGAMDRRRKERDTGPGSQ